METVIPDPTPKHDKGDPAQPAPLPLAGGAGGGSLRGQGKFKERNTLRAQQLRNAATPAERALWPYLSCSQLGVRFNRQMQVGPFFADFLCRKHKLVLELDGFSHDVQPERDVARDRYLRDAGYHVLHFTNGDVRDNVDGVVTTIGLVLQRLAHP